MDNLFIPQNVAAKFGSELNLVQVWWVKLINNNLPKFLLCYIHVYTVNMEIPYQTAKLKSTYILMISI